MSDEATRVCVECGGTAVSITILDRDRSNTPSGLVYHRSGDKLNFWTGKFPTAGLVSAFMCGTCGRISLYGVVTDGA